MFLNPEDPILNTGPNLDRDLFKRLVMVCENMPNDAVINAAANLIVNAIRQSHNHGRDASIYYDELMYKVKGLLMDHYDMLGRKRGIFPYDQMVFPPLHIEPKSYQGSR